MHRLAIPAAIALLLTSTIPAWAGGGLPTLADLTVGPFRTILRNDSSTLAIGANRLTVEAPSLPADHQVSLWLIGPHGQRVTVPLRAPITLGAASHGHDAEPTGLHTGDPRTAGPNFSGARRPTTPATSDHAASTTGGHGASHGSVAGASPPPAAARPSSPAAANGEVDDPDHAHGFLGYGVARVDVAGVWLAQFEIRDPQGRALSAATRLDAVDTSPNPVYLGASGLVIGGSLLMGVLQRRRRPDARRSTAGGRP